MTDDINKKIEAASLLPDRYYLIMNHQDEDSFGMTAYDTTQGDEVDMESIPAGMVALNGLIELLENDFERVWDAGVARISFISLAQSFKADFETDEQSPNSLEATDKVLSREDNIVKVNFGEKQ